MIYKILLFNLLTVKMSVFSRYEENSSLFQISLRLKEALKCTFTVCALSDKLKILQGLATEG